MLKGDLSSWLDQRLNEVQQCQVQLAPETRINLSADLYHISAGKTGPFNPESILSNFLFRKSGFFPFLAIKLGCYRNYFLRLEVRKTFLMSFNAKMTNYISRGVYFQFQFCHHEGAKTSRRSGPHENTITRLKEAETCRNLRNATNRKYEKSSQ